MAPKRRAAKRPSPKPRLPRALRRPADPTPTQRAQWHGISRIDQPSTRTHGWFVRVGFRAKRDGTWSPRHTRFFGDVTYGGPKTGLQAARRWRDEQQRHLRRARGAKRR